MDKRQWIQFISLSLAVMALWAVFNAWYIKHYPPAPEPSPTTSQSTPIDSGSPTPSTSPASTGPSTGPATTQNVQSMTVGLHAVPTTQPSADIILGSAAKADPTYAMQVTLTPQGAAIGDVLLNDYNAPRDLSRPQNAKLPYEFQKPFADHPGTDSLATRALIIDGKTIDLWNVPWNTVSSTAVSATFSIDIADAQGLVAKVTKTYRLSPRHNDKPGAKGFEVAVEQSIKNLPESAAIKVRAVMNGPTTPPTESEQTDDRMIVAGYDMAGKDVELAQHSQLEFKPGSATKELTTDDSNRRFLWAGQASSYFAAIVFPDPAAKLQYTVRAEALDPGAEIERNVAMTLETPDLSIAAGQEASAPMSLFVGPKWRDVMDDAYYASYPRKYDKLLIYSSKCCSFMTFQPLITGLVGVLWLFHKIFRDWGLSIICLVLCVRTLLHPLTKRSQVQMMKMGKLTPEVEKLKKKYADKPDELNREMMKIYKQQGGAMLGCLPMFLQTPIWIALWSALQSTFELRQAPFLYGLTWIKDLAKPDRLVDLVSIFGHQISIPIIVTTIHVSAINILPLLMAAVTYINQKYFMPMPIAATPEQEQQQKMQRGMSLLFPLMFYSLPSGLNIYYLTSMSLGILESKIVRDHIKEQEEAEKAGRVFVSAKPTRSAKRKDGMVGEPEPEKKPGLTDRLLTKMAEISKMAEEAKKEQEKRNGGKGKPKK